MGPGVTRTYAVLGLLLLFGCVYLTPPWERTTTGGDGATVDGGAVDVAAFETGGTSRQEDTGLPVIDAPTSGETGGRIDAPWAIGDGVGEAGSAGAMDTFVAGSETGGGEETRPADAVADAAIDPPLDGSSGTGADGIDAVRTGTGGAAGGGGMAGTGGSAGTTGSGGTGSGGAGTGGVGTGGVGTGGVGAGGVGTGGAGTGGVGTGGAGTGGVGTGGSETGGASGGADGGTDAGARSGAWTKIASSSPRQAYPGVAYDPALQRAVLFGGHTTCTEDAPTNRTWEWDGASWTMVAPAGDIPSARGSIRMAFDRAHGVAIVHGGWAPTDNPQPGTYSYNLATHTWTSLGTSLANLGWYALDYDIDAQLVRMFGGNLKTTFYRDVRSWNSTTQTWPGVAPTGPSARAKPSWAYDQQRRRFVMFGGFTSWGGTPCLAETWEYDPTTTTWQQTATTTAQPQDCDAPPLVYDPKRNVVVLYGSLNGGETWEYDAGTHRWTNVAGANQVGATSSSTIFYDEKLQAVLLVGGCTAGALQDGTWQYLPP
jgi:hypothetical protein